MEHYWERLEGVEGIHLNPIQENVESNYAYFPVIFDEKVFGYSRNEVADKLEKHGVFSRKYFYPLTNSFDCFHGKFDVNETPVAVHVAKRVLTLPLYSELSIEEIEQICDIILNMH